MVAIENRVQSLAEETHSISQASVGKKRVSDHVSVIAVGVVTSTGISVKELAWSSSQELKALVRIHSKLIALHINMCYFIQSVFSLGCGHVITLPAFIAFL